MRDAIGHIRRTYSDSITRSCRENRCSLQLDGVGPGSLAVIHGGRYQRNRGYTERLCDRIVFCRDHGFVLAAVELKGGRSVHMSHAVDQIQNGLGVAATILAGHPVSEWVPILLYNGRMTSHETRLLRNRSVEFRGERKNVVKRDCGARLSTILSR